MHKDDFYFNFLSRFVKQVVGPHEWNKRIMNNNLNATKLCIPSDEAFTLVTLENQYDCWLDIFVRNGRKRPPPQRFLGQDRKKTVILNVQPKYTTGGNVYDSTLDNNVKDGL